MTRENNNNSPLACLAEGGRGVKGGVGWFHRRWKSVGNPIVIPIPTYTRINSDGNLLKIKKYYLILNCQHPS